MVSTIVAGLPTNLHAAVFIVIHTAPDGPALLDLLLTRSGRLRAHYTTDGEPIRPGDIYLAPPDRHLVLRPDCVRVTRGPRENRFRPAVDPLFRTAAVAHGRRVIGIIVSGGQDDGAAGLAAIKRRGGTAIVQDPEEAIANGMPRAAARHVRVDFTARAVEIPKLVVRLVQEQKDRGDTPMSDDLPPDIAEAGRDAIHESEQLGPPSPFTCPDCGGTLWQSEDGDLLQFQCHVGHRYGGASLESAQSEALDHALWAALRALEESAELRQRMAEHAESRGMSSIAADYRAQALESEARAEAIRRILMPETAGRVAPVER